MRNVRIIVALLLAVASLGRGYLSFAGNKRVRASAGQCMGAVRQNDTHINTQRPRPLRLITIARQAGVLIVGAVSPLIGSAYQAPHIGADTVQAAVINLPRCEGGSGAGCDAMAEGSEFVRNLQKRSQENYSDSLKKKLINYNYNNFKDYFAFRGQVLLLRPDGRFLVLDKKVYDSYAKKGKCDGNRWLANEDPPESATEFVPSGSESFK